MHDAITVGVPVIAILFGILYNQKGVSDLKADLIRRMDEHKADLKAELRSLKERVTSRITVLERDYREFYRTQAQLELRMDGFEKKS